MAAEAALAAAGVMTKRYFFPVHRMEVYREFTNRFLPVTDHLHERLLCIPLYHDLSDDRIDGIAGIIRRSLGSGRRTITRPEARPGRAVPESQRPSSKIIRVDPAQPAVHEQGPTVNAGSMSLGESTSAFAEKPVTTDPVRCTYYFTGTSEGPASSLDCRAAAAAAPRCS